MSSLVDLSSQDAHDLSLPLLRQRRNLLLSSIAVAILEITGARFETISALGLQLTLSRPEAVNDLLSFAAVYFLYRYLIYLWQEPKKTIKDEFFSRLDRLALPKLLRIRDESYPEAAGAHLGGALSMSARGGPFVYSIQVSRGSDNAGGERLAEISVDLRKMPIKCLRAYAEAFLLRSYFTDYYLPLVIAASALSIAFVLE